MKKIIIITMLALIPSVVLSQGPNSFPMDKSDHYTKHKISQQRSDKKRRYKSITGNRYRYDLSDPSDRMDYKMDPDAQLDDKINAPALKIDRDLRQSGGGIDTSHHFD